MEDPRLWRAARDLGIYGALGMAGLETACVFISLWKFRPSDFTAEFVWRGVGSFLLQVACSEFPELAHWMLGQEAAPTPDQCSACLRFLAVGWRGRRDGERCERLAEELMRRGADVNFRIYRTTSLFVLCTVAHLDTGGVLLQKLLDAPELDLGGLNDWDAAGPAEELALRRGRPQAAKQICDARQARARWSAWRAAWAGAVARKQAAFEPHAPPAWQTPPAPTE